MPFADAELIDAVAAQRAGSLLFFASDEGGIERTALAVRTALPGTAWRAGHLVPGIRPDARVTAAVAGAFGA
jgi:hypothetical protein